MKRTRFLSVLLAVLLCGSLLPSAAAAPAGLSDIQGHWAQKEIEEAIDRGWVNGYPDDTFRPEKTISRAEFTKMLLAATKLTPDSETVQWMKDHASIYTRDIHGPHYVVVKPYQASFVDMDQNWLTKQGWTDAAIASGMVVPDDYNGKKFQPTKAIARYEIALMADRALGLVQPANRPLTEPLPFTDAADIQDWAKGYVAEAVKAGVIQGYPDGTFGPKKTATRAEAVVMVSRVLEEMEVGLDPSVSAMVHYTDRFGLTVRDEPVTGLLAQWVDGKLYLSFRHIYFAWSEAKSPGSDHADHNIWNPIMQDFSDLIDIGYLWHIRAGVPNYEEFNYELWGALSLEDSTGHFIAPVRMLYGELMVPVYEDGVVHDDYIRRNFCFNDGWDENTRTITLDLWEAPERNGS